MLHARPASCKVKAAFSPAIPAPMIAMRVCLSIFLLYDSQGLSILYGTGGEFSINGERSDARGVGARFIAPWGGVGPTTEPAHRILHQNPEGRRTYQKTR